MILLLLGASMNVQDVAARDKALRGVFDILEKSLRAPDEAAFKACWHAEAWEKNLVGGSGIPGKSVFSQGGRKKWFPKPDLSKAQAVADGAALIVPCEIWAWEKEKAVDQVDFLLVKEKDAWVVLGGGEKRAEVDALASRWAKKEPLAAPPEKE